MANAGLGFGVLGPLSVTAGGAQLPLGAPKQRAVLAMLLIHRNRPVSVDALIDGVWGAAPVPAARTSIQSYVSTLRRLLRSALPNPNGLLASVPPGYQLNVADADCDLGRFRGHKTAGVQAASRGRVEEADDLHNFAFVDAFANLLLEERVAAHTARAEAEIACGRADGVIGELEALVAQHPYREPLWAQLITAYYVTERQSDALGAYRRLKTALAEGLGIDPGPTVKALQQRILRQEPLGPGQPGKAARRAMLSTHKQSTVRSESAAAVVDNPVVARLRDKAGRHYQLNGVTTRIGRLDDNEIVLDDTEVSRHHAVIIDTGTDFLITDMKSTNGVQVRGRRVQRSATLVDGDHICIGNSEFVFEIRPA